MKILNITFKNINNLRGENTISFEKEPLKSAGIFAITGPTGSGKSTLLDVITLALFNKIPRFKGSISKNSIEGMGSVVTHHMNEASASIIYEIHNQKYTSVWSVGKTRTGNFKDYEMFIYDASGTPLDLKKSEVPAKNEDIIGLKYDQFVKSIILSQGQFSKFLKADKHERGQLLENLTGSSIYRKLSIKAFDKFKQVRDEVALEKDRLENIQTLSDEERNNLSQQIKSSSTEKTTLDGELEKLTHAKQIKSTIERLAGTLKSKHSEKDQLNQEKNTYQAKLDLLETYDKLSPILGELTRYNDATINLDKLTSDVVRNEQLIEEKRESRLRVMSELEQLTKTAVTIDNFTAVMSTFEREINHLNQEILFIGKKGWETRQRINTKAAQHAIAIDSKADPEATIPMLKEEIDSCNRIIFNAGLESEAKLKEVSENHLDQVENLKQLKELQHAYTHTAESRKRLERNEVALDKYDQEINKYKPLTLTSQELVKSTKENIALLDKQQQDARLIAKLTDHRDQLKEGEPCPLCGATHHPFAGHAPIQESEIAIQYQSAKEKLVEFERELEANNKKLTESLASKKMLVQQGILYKNELDSASKDQDVKLQNYKGDSKINEDTIQEVIKEVEEKVELLSRAVKSLQNRTVLNELVLDFEELQQILEEYKKLDKTLKERYSGNDVSKDCNLIQDKYVAFSTEIASLNSLITNNKSELKKLEGYIEKAKLELEPEVIKLGFESIEKANSFMISETELNQLKSKRDSLRKWETTLETEIKTLNEDLAKNQILDALPETDLTTISQTLSEKTTKKEILMKSIGEYSAKIEKDDQERARIKSKEKELEKLQLKFEKWSLLNKLIGEKTGNKFANFAQGLTLQNLLVFANKRLQKLSDRYLLDRPIKDGALTVIDLYQGNIQRSVSTLSGGESFLISLALALSLSDMASKNVILESLFIDEGFGTLDQESLGIAMDTLEKLQTESQKTVGVISHVEALKNRIHVQIKLEKSAQGYGTLRIEG